MGPIRHTDLAVCRADIGLHGVDRQGALLRDLDVGLALRDEGEHFGLTGREASALAWPVAPTLDAGVDSARDHDVASVDRLKGR